MLIDTLRRVAGRRLEGREIRMSFRVSVVIPAYRRETYVLEAVRSVLDSDLERDAYEILVVTDGISPELERRLHELDVSVLKGEAPTIGEMLARGVVAARGNVVAFLDDDDCFHPEKLRTVVDLFADPAVVYYHHGFQRVDANRHPLPASNEIAAVRARFSIPLSRKAAGWIRRKGGLYNTSSISVRRSAVLPRVELLRPVTNAQDFSIFLLLAGPGDVLFDGTRILSDYRTHFSQGTHFFQTDELPPDHTRFLRGTVRSLYWVHRFAPTVTARSFALCRAESYEVLLWTMTGEAAAGTYPPLVRAFRAVLGNLRERDVRSAAILAFLVFLSQFTRRLALRFYMPLKRIELTSLGLPFAGPPTNVIGRASRSD